MKHTHIGLRGKLIIAFLLISITPLLTIMVFASRHGIRITQKTQELQQYNEETIAALLTYANQQQTLKEELFSQINSNLSEEKRSELSEVLQGINNTFGQKQHELQNNVSTFRQNYQKILDDILGFNRKRQAFFPILVITVIIATSILAYIFGRILAVPIIQFTQIAQEISQGKLEQDLHVNARDELGQLHDAFRSMTSYMKDIAHTANNIANGNIQEISKPKSPDDTLGHAFYTMGQYLMDITNIAHQISNGNFGDHITLKSSEDILGKAFHTMSLNLSNAIYQIKQEVQAIGEAGTAAVQQTGQDRKMIEDILSSAEETSSSMTEMQASVEEVSGNMSVLSISIDESASSIEQMNASMKQIASNSSGLSNAAEETFVIVQEIGETITRLVTAANQAECSSKEASETAHAGQLSMNKIIDGMEVIQRVVAFSAQTINVLGNRSKEIDLITEVITDIADQTSLLALNASIIAAQAGEHGRGFAVVAQEVKELANRSLGAAKEIGDLIRSIQTEVKKAVQSIEEGRQAVENGVTLANRGGESLDTILVRVQTALEFIAENTRIAQEQAALSEQVRNYMGNVVTMVNEITRATTEQQKGSIQVTKAVEQMRDLAEQVKRATIEQSKGTTHVLEAMDNVTFQVQESSTRIHEVAQFAANLAQDTAVLTDLLDQFHIDKQVNVPDADSLQNILTPGVENNISI